MNKIKIRGRTIEFDKENVRIIDSYQVNDEVEMCAILEIFRAITNYNGKRSVESWLREWKTHNRLYKLGLFRSHTKDCDLEENEKIHRLIIYQILGR